MSSVKHERPGVYSSYDASSVLQISGGGKGVGIAAKSAGGTEETLYHLTRQEEAVVAFGPDDGLTQLVRLLFLNGAGSIYALPIRGGVTTLERVGGQTSVVRGVTTRTKTGAVSDATWRELTTVLIIDEVIPAIRNLLRAKFHRAKNTVQSRGAVRAQVILELEERVSRE